MVQSNNTGGARQGRPDYTATGKKIKNNIVVVTYYNYNIIKIYDKIKHAGRGDGVENASYYIIWVLNNIIRKIKL